MTVNHEAVIKRSYQRIHVGDRFGKLVVLALGCRIRDTEYFDWCRCDCGVVKEIRRGALQTGNTRSCGCLGEAWRTVGWGDRLTKHGRARTKFYRWWNSHHRSQGTLCPAWRQDFSTLLEEVGDRMEEEGLRPYRPNRREAYGPGNFEWR